MRINIKCSQAIHMLIMIAMVPAEVKVTSDFLAASIGNNPVEVRKLLSDLKKAGIVHVTRGPGGAVLAKNPQDITLLDVYHAVDPKSLDHLIGIHSHPSSRCLFGKNIANVLAEPYGEISQTVRDKMNAITLQHLCGRLEDLEPTIHELVAT